jgi:hypothetical protein
MALKPLAIGSDYPCHRGIEIFEEGRAMDQTEGQRRLVLGFDAGCLTCSELAKRIEERVGNKIEILSLNDPLMDHWRKEVFGEAVSWAPTLVEVSGGSVEAWTGARMGLKLVRVLGFVSALQLLQDVLAARNTDPVGSQATPVTHDPPGHAINRGQFIKRLSTGALAAGLASLGLGTLSSRASAAGAAGDTGHALGSGFATVAERRQFNRAVELLARHLCVGSDGTLRISDSRVSDAIKAGTEEGVPRRIFRELVASLDIANEQILEGELSGGSRLISPGVQEVAGQESRSNDLDTASGRSSVLSCRGKSGRSIHWWGVRMKLNSCQANTLIYYCTIEAGALTLCTKIWVIPCRIAAFLLLVQCATYRRAADPGRGIVIDKSWGLKLPRVYSQ